jgi:hypothetical protein
MTVSDVPDVSLLFLPIEPARRTRHFSTLLDDRQHST